MTTQRCAASSWRGRQTKKRGPFGPGGFNRCVRPDGHPEGLHHLDEFGNVFVLSPRFRVLRHQKETP